jgi:hypothetical protein
MNVLDSVLATGSAGVAEQLAGQFASTRARPVPRFPLCCPRLGGLKEKLASGGGTALSDLISSGSLSSSRTTLQARRVRRGHQGNSLLKQIFGGGDLSNIASTVAQKVGISSGVVTAMLPS